VPWKGPVPAPGASKVMIGGDRGTEGVLLKYRRLSFVAAPSNCANAKSTPTLMNVFRRIFVLFIT
jgi:hypothetical protein